jgi:hypothetical protein
MEMTFHWIYTCENTKSALCRANVITRQWFYSKGVVLNPLTEQIHSLTRTAEHTRRQLVQKAPADQIRHITQPLYSNPANYLRVFRTLIGLDLEGAYMHFRDTALLKKYTQNPIHPDGTLRKKPRPIFSAPSLEPRAISRRLPQDILMCKCLLKYPELAELMVKYWYSRYRHARATNELNLLQSDPQISRSALRQGCTYQYLDAGDGTAMVDIPTMHEHLRAALSPHGHPIYVLFVVTWMTIFLNTIKIHLPEPDQQTAPFDLPLPPSPFKYGR